MTAEIARVTDYVDDVTAAWGNGLAEAIAKRPILPGRLTLQTGVAVPTSDQTAKTTLYYTLTQTTGSILPLYSGAYWQGHAVSADLSISLAGLSASTVYDVFVYDNAGTPTLELLAWASSTARATGLGVQNGMLVKAGAATRLYLGTILADVAGGACTDGINRRGVWNQYNQAHRWVQCYNSTGSWTYATAAWRELNGGTGMVRGEFVIGRREGSILNLIAPHWDVTSGQVAQLEVVLNAVTGASATRLNFWITSYQTKRYEITDIDNAAVYIPPMGYNYLSMVEWASGGTTPAFTGGQDYNAAILLEM
jgi:hypothetical protein